MKNILSELESVVKQGLLKTPLPYKKGNTIRIGHVVIRESKTHGHILFDVVKQKQIAVLFSKTAALALAKNYISDKDYQKIFWIDTKYQKNYNDIMFYKHTIDKTKDEIKKCVALDRLDLANAELNYVNDVLENIIFDD